MLFQRFCWIVRIPHHNSSGTHNTCTSYVVQWECDLWAQHWWCIKLRWCLPHGIATCRVLEFSSQSWHTEQQNLLFRSGKHTTLFDLLQSTWRIVQVMDNWDTKYEEGIYADKKSNGLQAMDLITYGLHYLKAWILLASWAGVHSMEKAEDLCLRVP